MTFYSKRNRKAKSVVFKEALPNILSAIVQPVGDIISLAPTTEGGQTKHKPTYWSCPEKSDTFLL